MGAEAARSIERVFFALWPDARCARRFHALGQRLVPSRDVRAMRADTLHLTLTFVGDVPRTRIPELKALGAQVEFEPFVLTMDFVDRWARNRIVWVGSSEPPSGLGMLAERLGRLLDDAGFSLEPRPFVPHLTLLRKVPGAFARRPIEPVHWEVGAFVLVASRPGPQGAHYPTLARWSAVGA